MSPGKAPARRARTLLLALLLIAAAAPAAALAAPTAGGGPLSTRLAELAGPSLRSSGHGRQAHALSLARSGPGSLLRDGNRILVEVRFDRGAAARVGQLRAAGGSIVSVRPRYQTVTVAVRTEDLRALAGAPDVESVREVLTPIAFAACPSGESVSEGDVQLRAKEAREEFGVDGSGVTVGILSDSFDQAKEAADGSGPVATNAKEDVEEGDLPGAKSPCENKDDATVLEEFKPGPGEEEGVDEGRGMLQIVHDLAPGADLSFASAFNGPEKFAENIEALAIAGADVIADDVIYFEEPFFQEGPIAVAARNVSEQGGAYFSAAGNDNLLDSAGREISSWEAPGFRDSGSCPGAVVALSRAVEELEAEEEEKTGEEFPGIGLNARHCADFDPSSGADTTFGITVEKGEILSIDLQWAEPWFGVDTDLDALLLDSNGQLLESEGFVVGSLADNIGEGLPLEVLQWENDTGADRTVQLVINRYTGTSPRLKFILLQNGGGVSAIEYPESRGGDLVGPSIFGHSGAPDAISVGAVPFDDSSSPESYSSRGPVTHYFGPVVGTEPADPLASPEELSKPDLAATDCGVTSFFASQDPLEDWRFCGTSAAAPHAAAVAALALEAQPGIEAAQVLEAEINSAAAVGDFGSCAVGGGLVDAFATIEALQGELGPPPAPCEAPDSPAIVEPLVRKATPQPPESPPKTFVRKKPRKVVRTRRRSVRIVFRFGSNVAGAGFECRIDRGRFRRCLPKLARRFKLGRHVVRVRAVSPSGETDASPAVVRFRVKRVTGQPGVRRGAG
jgi:subtilisin family serine protease